MKISIITVTLNSVDTIRDCMMSVKQSNANIEHIVIDGLSSDGTIDVLREFEGESVKVVSECDDGIYDALNKGLSYATGDVIGVLHSDDVFFSNQTLSDVAKIFSDLPGLDVLYGDAIILNPLIQNKVARFYSGSWFSPWKLRFGFMPPHTATFMRREVFERLGCYEPKFISAGDFEFFVRIFWNGVVSYRYEDKIFVKMRSGGMSDSGIKSYTRTSREMLIALKDNKVYSNIFILLMRLPIKFFMSLHTKFKFRGFING